MDIYSIIKLSSLIIHAILGLFVLIWSPKNRLNQSLCLLFLSIALMELGYWMYISNPNSLIWMRFALIGQCATAANTVFVSLLYGRENYASSLKAGKIHLIIVYIFSALFLVAILTGKIGIQLWSEDGNYRLLYSRFGIALVLFLFSCNLVALINLENTYRHADRGRRRGKYPIIVFIAMLVFQIVLYSWILGVSRAQIEILSTNSITLVLTGIFISYFAIRPTTKGSRIYVGHTVIARSYTLLLAGIYLLIVGLMGEIVKMIGRNLNFFLAFLASFFIVFLLIVGLLSKSLKQRFSLFIRRNFYRARYDYRREWENFSRRVFSVLKMDELLAATLDTISETMNADSISIVMLGNPGSMAGIDATTPDDPRVQYLNLGVQEDEFLDWLWRYGKPVGVNGDRCVLHSSSSEPPEFSAFMLSILNKLQASKKSNEANAVLVPIIAENMLMGVMILGNRPIEPFTQADIDLLETMANQFSIAVMNARANQELAISRELESLYRLSTMLLHDLKGAASMLSLVVQNAVDNFDNPEFQKDALSTMASVVDRIQRLILKLSTAPKDVRAKPELQRVDLTNIVNSAITKSGIRNMDRISAKQRIERVPYVMVDAENIEGVVLNLILNAIEAIKGEGEIEILMEQTADEHIQFSIKDSGDGMSDEFIRDNLFRPFQTTKPRGMGLGLYHSKAIVEACNGVIDVQSEEGVGSVFSIKLPVQEKKK